MSRPVAGSRPAVLVVEDEAAIRLSAMDMVEAVGAKRSAQRMPTKRSAFLNPAPTFEIAREPQCVA